MRWQWEICSLYKIDYRVTEIIGFSKKESHKGKLDKPSLFNDHQRNI